MNAFICYKGHSKYENWVYKLQYSVNIVLILSLIKHNCILFRSYLVEEYLSFLIHRRKFFGIFHVLSSPQQKKSAYILLFAGQNTTAWLQMWGGGEYAPRTAGMAIPQRAWGNIAKGIKEWRNEQRNRAWRPIMQSHWIPKAIYLY